MEDCFIALGSMSHSDYQDIRLPGINRRATRVHDNLLLDPRLYLRDLARLEINLEPARFAIWA